MTPKGVIGAQRVNEFSSKFVNLARNVPKLMEINSKCVQYHFKSLCDEKGGKGL